MLKPLKQAVLRSARMSGVFSLVKNSRWRRDRLLILAYHGIALDDEHRWKPALFLHQDTFRARLRLIRRSGCTVLPLADALRRLYAGDLPERSVALTFDDGTYDFYERAHPILKEFNVPATVYLSTFYSEYNRPVFDVIASYILWKGRGGSLNLREFTGRDSVCELADDTARAAVLHELHQFADRQELSAEEKDELTSRLSRALRVGYEDLLHKRILHIMTPQEVTRIASEGVDVQLHTHRHRTPSDERLFLREIEDNRKRIQAMTGSLPTHFCYPSGVYKTIFLPWLRAAGIESATTCDPGMGTRGSEPLLLPRLVDSATLSLVEFEGWLTGVCDVLPHRARA
jgi:peptidoglycan/xylan/chitin deacetylase (PgdA/CDA1 family)